MIVKIPEDLDIYTREEFASALEKGVLNAVADARISDMGVVNSNIESISNKCLEHMVRSLIVLDTIRDEHPKVVESVEGSLINLAQCLGSLSGHMKAQLALLESEYAVKH